MVIMVLIKLRSSQAWCQSNQIESQAWCYQLKLIRTGDQKQADWVEGKWRTDRRFDHSFHDKQLIIVMILSMLIIIFFPDDDIIFCQYFHGDAILIARFMIP